MYLSQDFTTNTAKVLSGSGEHQLCRTPGMVKMMTGNPFRLLRCSLALASITFAWGLAGVLFISGARGTTLAACEFKALYNFGDSNSDTGGRSAAFGPIPAPNGEGFFGKPSGRDGDGRLIIDFIAERLRFPYLSAYLNTIGTNYRYGANFASGGATIAEANETVYAYGISPFYLGMQIAQFDQFKSRAADLFQQVKLSPEANRLPRVEDYANALYTFDIGQNDLTMGFRTKSVNELRSAIPGMIEQLAQAIQHLYKQGGRSFWIHNTGPIGCLPVHQFETPNPPPGYFDKYGCVKYKNEMAIFFNSVLKERVGRLRAELPLAAITHVDVFSVKHWLVMNAKSLGLANSMGACCGYHVRNDNVWCGFRGTVNNTEITGPSCRDPSHFVSWDGVHYTEFANRWVADHTLNGSFTDPPTSISQACHRQ